MKYPLILCFSLLLCAEVFSFQTIPSKNLRDLGYEAFEKEDWSAAQAYLDQWLQTHPSDYEAYWYRGQAFQNQGNLDRALGDFNSLLTLNPDYAEALFERGRVRYLLKQYAEAREDFENYLKTPPGETTRILYKIGPGSTGVSAVTTDQTGRQDQAYYHLGLCSIAEEEFEFAIFYLDEAILINPKDPDFYTEKGRALTRLGDNVPAIEAYGLALRLNPDHLPAKQGLALVKNGGDEVLLRQLDEVIADSTANSQTFKQRGFYRMNHQDDSGAIQDFTQAIALDAMDSESYFYLGKVFAKQKNWAKAEANYAEALDLEPQNAEYYLARGQARYLSGKLDPALADFTLTITNDPEHASGYYHRGITYQRMGRIKEACSDLRTAVKLGMEAAEDVLKKVCGTN
jgi:tetratricopeptide (TPR) repeat protein